MIRISFLCGHHKIFKVILVNYRLLLPKIMDTLIMIQTRRPNR